MLCRKYVCRQAVDAFVLRLHDVSGTLLKIIFRLVLLPNCALEGSMPFCYFSVDVCSRCLSEPNTGGRTYTLLRARHVYPLLLPLSVFLDVYSGNVLLYDDTIHFS